MAGSLQLRCSIERGYKCNVLKKIKDWGGLDITEVWFNPANVNSLIDISSLDSYSAVVIDISYCVRSRFGCHHLTSDIVFVTNNIYIVTDIVSVFNSFIVFLCIVTQYLRSFAIMYCMSVDDCCNIEYHVSSKDKLRGRRL